MTKLLRRMAGLASAVLFVGVFVGTAPAASAAPASPTALSRAELTQVGPSSLDAALVCTSTVNFSCTCFGYRGNFRANSAVVRVAWATTSSECFGIAPGRTIYHAWPGSGGWRLMPGNGRADDMSTFFGEDPSTGFRVVSVWVNGIGAYCQDYFRGSGWTARWYRC